MHHEFPVFNLFSVDGSDGFRLDGEHASDRLGTSVSSAGDVNGDGFDDVIIGAPWADANAEDDGSSYVVFGKAGGFDATLSLSSLDGSNGFRLDGGHHKFTYGNSVTEAGDINGDGFDDVMVKGSEDNYVVFGRSSGFDAQMDLTTLDGSNGFRLKREKSLEADHTYLGIGGADVNGDGFDDAIVQTFYLDQNNHVVGSGHVVFGHAGGFDATIDLSTLDGESGFRLMDLQNPGELTVTGSSDINGDGLDDLLVTTDSTYDIPYGGGGGEVSNYVVYGKTSGFAAVEDLADLDANEGVHLNTDVLSVSSAGDINGDGLDDLVFFAKPSSFEPGLYNYVVFGKVSGINPNLDLSQLDGSDGFTLGRMFVDEKITARLEPAGDVNGDGFGDLIVGAEYADPYGMANAGSSYVIFGHASGFDAVVNLPDLDSNGGIRLDGIAGNAAGVVSGAGDIDNDGFDDVIVGAPGAGASDHDSGASYVLLGGNHLKETTVFVGTAARNELTGTPAMEYFTGKGDNDILSGGGGADVFSGDTGDDIIRVPDPDFQSANGGAGNDTLAFTGNHIELKLDDYIDRSGQLNLSSRIVDIETIDLTGNGDNTLTLTAQSVRDVSDSSDTLVVKGNAGDRVEGLSDGWIDAGMKDGMHAFTKQGVELLIDTTIVTNPPFTPSVIDLSSLDGHDGFRLDGVAESDFSGRSVSGAGDINGDGFDDVLIGASGSDTNGFYSGSSYVVFGKASGFAAHIDLSTLDGTNGFSLDGTHQNDSVGISVSDTGDVNGDGFDDVIVSGAGSSYVMFGKASGFDAQIDVSSMDGQNGFRLVGGNINNVIGHSVSNAGDVNGDGFNDVMVEGFGEFAYVVFGRASGFDATIDISTLDGSNGFRLKGEHYSSLYAVSAAGDINGDGLGDVIMGSEFVFLDGDGSGSSYVVFGRTTGFDAQIDLTALDGSNGFRLDGASGDYSGSSVSDAGDVNGDGFGDVIIGAQISEQNGHNSGTSYVVFGKGSDFNAVLELDNLDGSNGFQLTGSYEGDQLGFSVSGAGDVNGDGFDDVIVSSAPYDDSCYVVFGKASGFGATLDISALDGSNGVLLKGTAGERVGYSVSSAGDINGDGFDDLIVGAPNAGLNGDYAGASYVIFGSRDFGNGGGSGGELPEIKGTDGDDTLKGSETSEHFLAGDGNDNLLGRGGADVFDAGAGDDAIRIGDLTFASVDGGDGNDALHLAGADLNLDLTTLGDHIHGVETICLYGRGDNTLTLTADSLLGLSDSTNTLKVHGNSGDHIVLQDDGWADGGSHGFYHTYTHDDAVLLVGANVTVEFV